MSRKRIKDFWFVSAELPHNTLFMMSPCCRFFLQKWPKLGLGDKVKVYFSYFKGDFSQMWYKRREFDAEAEFLTRKMIKNPNWALKIIDKVEDWSKRFMNEAEKFRQLFFAKMGLKQMIKAYKRVLKCHELSHGVGASVSWHADCDKERVTKAITAMIENQIKKRHLNLLPANVFSILSTPEGESFAQKEEKEFLKIACKISQSPAIVKIFQNTKLKFLEERIRNTNHYFFDLIYKHFQNWAWLPYGYKGPAYDLKYFLERWQTIFTENVSPSKIFKEILRRENKTKKEQKNLLAKLKFSPYQLKLIRLAQRLVFIKEFRKGALYHGMYCYEPFFREVAKRLGLTLEQVWAMNSWEIPKFLKKGKAPRAELNLRLKEAVAYVDRERYVVWTGKKAKDFFRKIPKEKVVTGGIKELLGTCASPGYAKGAVKIIDIPGDMGKMNQGDILVSETTYPSLVPAMKKAAAIVTNAGGLTCHAAIVSRELGIPCVVGTKVANKVLKDGQLVEVDANKGVVKIIK